METTSQVSNGSIYVSAPTSTTKCSSPNSMQFYSAPTSPTRSAENASYGYENEDLYSTFDEFEFETTKKFGLEGFGFSDELFSKCTSVTVASADELFSNGQLLPLKLPPRLQSPVGTNYNSTASLARSPGSLLGIVFPRQSMWNDEFDPFTVALEKVKEENGGYSCNHRRTRSLSPCRTSDSGARSQHQHKQSGPLELMQHQVGRNRYELMESKQFTGDPMSPIPFVPLSQYTYNRMKYVNLENHEFQGKIVHSDRKTKFAKDRGFSPYGKWFGRLNKETDHQRELSPMEPPHHKRSWSFGRGVKPLKVGHEGTIKPDSTTIPGLMVKKGEKTEASLEGGCSAKTRKQRAKGYLRYASFGRDKNEGKLKEQIGALWKKLNSKLKENAHAQSNTVKKVCGEPKMEITPYKPRVVHCLSFRMESPRRWYSP